MSTICHLGPSLNHILLERFHFDTICNVTYSGFRLEFEIWIVEDYWDWECPTLVNLVEDHEFISEEYYLHWYEAFWGSPKQSHESLGSKWTELRLKVDNIIPLWRGLHTQSGQYHTIVERFAHSKWTISYHCGEGNKTFLIRVCKPLPSRRVLKS